MTTPSESALASVLANAALTAYAEHERIRCNVGMGGPLSQCGCVCGEVLPECRPSVHAEHRRLHVAAAILAATDARTEADGAGWEFCSWCVERPEDGPCEIHPPLNARTEADHPFASEAHWDGCAHCGRPKDAHPDPTARIAHLEAALAAAEAKLSAVERLIHPDRAMAQPLYGSRWFDEADIRAALAVES